MKHKHLPHHRPAARAERGFTLIEVMIVVAIVAILAAVAYPSYQRHVMASRRAVAQGCLNEMVQFMERFYTTNMRYDKTPTDDAVKLPTTSCQTDLAASYDFGFSADPTATTYALRAVARGPQAGDSACATLGVNSLGQKTPAVGCWK